MELKNTIDMMTSADYKERFKAEYYQTKERYEKLKAFNTKIAVAKMYNGKYIDMPKHDCPDELLVDQENIMMRYLNILETRAMIEGIEL